MKKYLLLIPVLLSLFLSGCVGMVMDPETGLVYYDPSLVPGYVPPYYVYDGVDYYYADGRYYYDRDGERYYVDRLPRGGRYTSARGNFASSGYRGTTHYTNGRSTRGYSRSGVEGANHTANGYQNRSMTFQNMLRNAQGAARTGQGGRISGGVSYKKK